MKNNNLFSEENIFGQVFGRELSLHTRIAINPFSGYQIFGVMPITSYSIPAESQKYRRSILEDLVAVQNTPSDMHKKILYHRLCFA